MLYDTGTCGRRAIYLAALLSLAACTAPLPVVFDADAANYIFAKGSNVITGRAYLASQSEYMRHCTQAQLIPVTNYSREWMSELFPEKGNTYVARAAIEQMPDDPGFERYQRTVECDKNGRFQFDGVADGTYYVFAPIYWLNRWQRNGGGLMKEVVVFGGRAFEISLTKP